MINRVLYYYRKLWMVQIVQNMYHSSNAEVVSVKQCRKIGIAEEVSFLFNAKVLDDLDGVEQESTRRTIEAGPLFGEVVILRANAVTHQEQHCLVLVHQRRQSVQPITVRGNHIALLNTALL